MEFASSICSMRATTTTAAHVSFVQERWLSEVSEFLELDYAAR